MGFSTLYRYQCQLILLFLLFSSIIARLFNPPPLDSFDLQSLWHHGISHPLPLTMPAILLFLLLLNILALLFSPPIDSLWSSIRDFPPSTVINCQLILLFLLLLNIIALLFSHPIDSRWSFIPMTSLDFLPSTVINGMCRYGYRWRHWVLRGALRSLL